MVHTTCSVYGCLSSSRTNKDLKFHQIPRGERGQIWINACQRPDLKELSTEKLKHKYVCCLHFVPRMYAKNNIKKSAIPVLNLPPASIHSVSTQTDLEAVVPSNLSGTAVQQHIKATAVNVYVLTPTTAPVSQSSDTSTEHTSRKRKREEQLNSCPNEITLEQFLHGCDMFLPPNLSKSVKEQAKLHKLVKIEDNNADSIESE